MNQMIVRVTDQESLFREASLLLLKLENLRCLGLVNEKETKNVEPIMVAGENQGYLTNIKTITADDSTPQGRGPGATAIKTKNI
jgi:hypothetical protein